MRAARAHHLLVSGALALGVVLTVSSADAQERCRACELDEAAREATASGRLADADRMLTESLELRPRAATLYNLAVVRQNRGRLVDARLLLERLLSGELGRIPAARRAEVTERLADVLAGIGAVVLALEGLDDDAERPRVRLDGRPMGVAGPDGTLRLSVDPGSHVLTVYLEDGRVLERTFDVEPGATREVRVNVLARAVRPAPTPLVAIEPPVTPPVSVEERTPRRRRILLAVAGVVAVGGAIALAVGLSRGAEAGPPDTYLGTLHALAAF
ncbi:MAG: hypothetical protein KF901_17530 [Myxococcales bacterium]|nr:hypothetical protein [Myxococcales bacterium]